MIAAAQADASAKQVRILVVDDNLSICEDFRKVLAMAFGRTDELASVERELFGDSEDTVPVQTQEFQLDAAPSGRKALEMVERSIVEKNPYALAFVDFRMPPGWNGIETVSRLWDVYADLECVLCTAYADLSCRQIIGQVRHRDRFLVLKKPFDPIEVVQMTICLAERWTLRQQAKRDAEHLGACCARAARLSRDHGPFNPGAPPASGG